MQQYLSTQRVILKFLSRRQSTPPHQISTQSMQRVTPEGRKNWKSPSN